MFDLRGKRVFVAVIADLAGAAIARRLAGENYEVLVANRDVLDLSDQRLPKIGWSERALMRISWLPGLSVVSTPTATILPTSSQTTLRSPLTSSVPLIRLA